MSALKAVDNSPTIVKVTMKMLAEKKGSVRYKAVGDEPAITDAYIMKHSLPMPFPQTVELTLTFK